MISFYYESKFKIIFFRWGGWEGGGARVSDFFSKNPNLKKNKIGEVGGEAGLV